jgi:hypothetical protein
MQMSKEEPGWVVSKLFPLIADLKTHIPSTALLIPSCIVSCSSLSRCTYLGSRYIWPATKRLTSESSARTASGSEEENYYSTSGMKREVAIKLRFPLDYRLRSITRS